jgi:hypothetical protein
VDTFIRPARESGLVATALRDSGHAEVTVAG